MQNSCYFISLNRRQSHSDLISYLFVKLHAMVQEIIVLHCWDSSLEVFQRSIHWTVSCNSRLVNGEMNICHNKHEKSALYILNFMMIVLHCVCDHHVWLWLNWIAWIKHNFYFLCDFLYIFGWLLWHLLIKNNLYMKKLQVVNLWACKLTLIT